MSGVSAGISDDVRSFYSGEPPAEEPAPTGGTEGGGEGSEGTPAPAAPPEPGPGPLMGNPPEPKGEEQPKEDPKPEDAPKDDDAPKEEGDPLDFEVALPQGAEVQPEVLASFKGKFGELAKEVGLSSEAASKLASGLAAWQLEQGAAQAELDAKALTKLQDDWANTIRTKYGDGFQASHGRVQQTIERFGGAPFRDMVTQLGLGNQPVLWDLLDAVGKAIEEVKPGAGGGGQNQTNSREAEIHEFYSSASR